MSDDHIILLSTWLGSTWDSGAWINGSWVVILYDSMYTVWTREPKKMLYHGAEREHINKLLEGDFMYGETYEGWY